MDKYIVMQISGKVQDVWFRKFTQSIATEIGLIGYVKNNSDGTVQIEACGNNEQLQQFIVLCHKGPKMACVDNIEYEINDDCNKNYKDFKIL